MRCMDRGSLYKPDCRVVTSWRQRPGSEKKGVRHLKLFRSAKLLALGLVVGAAALAASAESQRWLNTGEVLARTDGVVRFIPLPNKGSAPTTISIARDGVLWFTESNGNRIG